MFEYLTRQKVLWFLVILLTGLMIQFSLDVIFSVLYKTQGLFSSWVNYMISVGLSVLMLYGLSFLTSWMNRKYPWEKSPAMRVYIQVILTSLFVAGMVMIMRLLILTAFFPSGFIRLLDELIIAVIFVIFGLLLLIIDTGVSLLNRWRVSLAEIEKFRRENLATQFEMLRVQVNPHFLFNSLNTLSSLIYQNQDTASHFVRELSSVYRYILEKRKDDIVPLREELQFTDSYRYLLGLRFDQKLLFRVEIEEKMLNRMIIPLTLQILIENAVKHNVVSMKKPLEISIVTRDDNTLVLANNLQKKKEETYSSGIGLDNIRSRLKILTDRTLDVHESENEFRVTIPLLEEDEIKKIYTR
ncbi:MAG: histidine kinase [Bacteroidetes bacterium]|nr:histidine kinase [Bacteroidota bacterium]